MAGNYSKVKTVVTGELITASDRNTEHDNHITYNTPAGLDDYSANDAQMQTITDPYPGAVQSLATSTAGELERLRYVIAQITGETYWFIDPDTTIASTASHIAASSVHGVSGAVVGTTDTQTLTNKSLSDSTTFFIDNADPTKKLQFQLSGINTGVTRTATWPDVDLTVVGIATSQTLTNKTIDGNSNTLTVLESQITDSTILARVAGNETVTGAWVFTGLSNFTRDNGSDSATAAVTITNSDVTSGQGNGLRIIAGNGSSDYSLYVTNRTGSIDSLYVGGDGKVGIGINPPDVTLHVMASNASATSAGSSVLTVEKNDDLSINILTPNNKAGSILFGDPESASAGSLSYDHSTNTLSIQTADTTRWSVNATKFAINVNTIVGSLSVDPDSKLHVWQASAGTVSAVSNTVLTIESSTHDYLSFLSPNNVEAGLIFGDPDSNVVGKAVYDHTLDAFVIRTGGTDRVSIAASSVQINASTFIGGLLTPDSTLHLYGGTAGTITAVANTILTIENSTEAYISFLTPNTAVPGIYFGDPQSNTVGAILYSHVDNVLTFRTNGAVHSYIDSTGRINNDLTTGTAPFVITSTTVVTNLNAELHGGLKVKVIDIGDWNMDTTASVNVAHGLTLANIRSVHVLVRNDADTSYYDSIGWVSSLLADLFHSTNGTNVVPQRLTAGFFDSATFDSTSFNRGWVTIFYT